MLSPVATHNDSYGSSLPKDPRPNSLLLVAEEAQSSDDDVSAISF